MEVSRRCSTTSRYAGTDTGTDADRCAPTMIASVSPWLARSGLPASKTTWTRHLPDGTGSTVTGVTSPGMVLEAGAGEQLGWLLVSVSTAGAPASTRVLVWRRLRGLGAVYLQQSVSLLPDLPVVRQSLESLLERVRAEGGTARLLHVRLPDAEERRALVADFRLAADREYDDLLGRVPSLLAELESERASGRASFVEVEENEADLARFRSWLAKIAARDYFEAPLGERARAALVGCAVELAAFEREAFAAENTPPSDLPAADLAAAVRPDMPAACRAGGT